MILVEEDLFSKLFLPAKSSTKQRPLPSWEWVYQELRKKGVTLQLLWREYRDTHSTGLSYTQFCECYRAYTKATTPVMRTHIGKTKHTFQKFFKSFSLFLKQKPSFNINSN